MFRTLAAVNTGRGRPPTPGTLHRIRATLRVALNAAIREGLRSDNPARHIELPGPRRPHAQVWTNQRINAWREQGQRPIVAVWTVQQLSTFLDQVAGDRLSAMWWLIALRGLRRGRGRRPALVRRRPERRHADDRAAAHRLRPHSARWP